MPKHDAFQVDRRLSVAPMMSYTDRHFRHFFRLISKKILLYTEMVVSGTIIHNQDSTYLQRILAFEPSQSPIAVQLGGDNPEELALSARICEDFGYQEINLNIGCPSDRVQKGAFGAVLMKEPEKVADLVQAMQRVVRIPVTVKHRIGVDDLDSFEFLARFVEVVSQAGCRSFSVHARKAWLKGLSPAQNRSVPPINYERVYQLKQLFPHLEIIVNGHIENIEQAQDHLRFVDGVMVGRAAYHHPLLFNNADREIFGDPNSLPIETTDLLDQFQTYYDQETAHGTFSSAILRHLLGFFKGEKGSRLWRQKITEVIQEKAHLPDLAELYDQSIGRFV